MAGNYIYLRDTSGATYNGKKALAQNTANVGYELKKAIARNTAGTDTLIWQGSLQIYPGYTAYTRQTTYDANPGTWYAGAWNTQDASGASSCAYSYIDIAPWSNCRINFYLNQCSPNGMLFVGFGNFDSYTLNGWPTLTDGLGYPALTTANGYASGYTGEVNINLAGRSATVCIGCAAASRSSNNADSHITINSIVLS